jgi:crotonobetainyl-CoA:carnitine CoA-transferase CaiB-like acyl-CoA transferase
MHDDGLPNPLQGIMVLDLGRAIAAPFCAQMLADMGAEVIKIERPRRGDETRHLRPALKDDRGADTGYGHNFISANRNKKSLTLDISQERGQQILRLLCAGADVLVENFKVGDLARYSLDYESIRAVNPGIIYCSITGYGQNGPYATRAGYDSVFQAQSGVMSMTGEPDGEPQRIGYLVADMNTALTASTAILGALYGRDANDGAGQHIDLALLDSQIAAMSGKFQSYLVSGQIPGRVGSKSPGGVPAQAVTCADGLLQISAAEDAHFRNFSRAIGRPDLLDDARFATREARMEHRDDMTVVLNEIFSQRSTDEWTEVLERENVIHGRLNDVRQALEDPQVQHRKLLVHAQHEKLGAISMIRNPIRYSRTPLNLYQAPPDLGQHTREILANLGIDEAEQKALSVQGII